MKQILEWIKYTVLCVLAAQLAGCGGADPAPPRATTQAAARPLAYVANPQNGWWWNATEGGSGYAIEVQGNQIFMSTFMYEVSGAPTWYVSTLTRQADNQFTGVLTRYAGGQTLLGNYKSPSTTVDVANVSLAFSSDLAGTLRIVPTAGAGVRSVAIERFPISTPTAFATPTSTFQNGWWWNADQGGRGFFIEVQGSQAFMGAFMYGANGEPTWYVSSASVSGGTLVSGPLQQYTGGQSLLGTWRSPTANAQSSGTMEFHLTAPNVGTLVLPNGVVVALTRFPFNLPPLTLNTLKSCPESTYVYDSTKLACLAGTQAVGKVDPTGEPCVMTFTTQGVALNSAAYSASYAGPYEDVSPGADFSFLYHDSHADAGASSMLLELIITSLSEQFQLEASLSPGSQDIYAKTSSQANAVTAPTNPLGQMTCRFTLN